MKPKKAYYNLSNRFRILIFLTGTNNKRSISLAKYFAEDIKVLYITPDELKENDLDNSNIEVYCFKGILEKLATISRDILINRISLKIKKTLKENKIDEHDTYIFVNNMIYAPLFKNAPFYGHFDFVDKMKDIYITDFHRFELMNKIRSVSTLTTKNSKMLEPYLSPVFKIFDGIEIDEQVKEKKQTEKLTFGCYLEDFRVINPFFLNEIASLNPNYNFLFISKNSTPILFDFKKNIQQVLQQPDINTFDYILFPFEKEEPYEVNKTFYLNLRFNAPMLAIQSLELKHNEAFVNQYKKKANLMLALKNIESIKHPDLFEKEILKQNIDWQTRIKQLESIILAYS